MKLESEDFSPQGLIPKRLAGKTGATGRTCGQGEQQLKGQLKGTPSALGKLLGAPT